VGLFSLGGSGGGEVRRIRRNVVLLLVLSAGAALLLAFVFRLDVRETALSLIMGGVAPPSLYLTYRQTVGSENRDDVQADDGRTLTETVLTRLATTVEKQWDKEYGVRTYSDPAQKFRDIKASWSAAEPPVAPHWETLVDLARGAGAYEGMRPVNWARRPDGLTGLDEGDLRDILEKVPTGWLVVLGESGSGKTMLMLRTVREIVKHGQDATNLRNRKDDDPVPLFVPMTSWNPKREDLRAWLERQLPIDYPGLGARVTVGGKQTTVIAMLLDEQKIIPVLDGLDEMSAGARVKAISRLNEAFIARARPLRLVVTCRTREYRRAVGKPGPGRDAHPVLAAAAIELQPLDPDKVSAYLADRGKNARWAAVNAKLMQSGGVLAKGLDTPLYASLASEIYNPRSDVAGVARREPGELASFADEESLHHHLLDEFIPAVYATEYEDRGAGQAPPGDEDEDEYEYEDHDSGRTEQAAETPEEQRQRLSVERWLMILADYLTTGRERPKPSLEWWDLGGLAPRWLVPATIGTVCGIATAVAAATGTHVGVGIGVGFGTGMLIAIAIGLSVFHARKRWDRRRLTEKAFDDRYAKRRPGPGMTGGMIGAVMGGVAAGVAGKYHIGHSASLFSAVPEALGMALGAGATTDFLGGLAGVLVGAFAGGYLAAVGLGLPAGLVNGLGVGVAVALVIDMIGRDKPSRTTPYWEIGVGLVGGGVIGLAIGLIVWREAGVAYGIVFGVLLAALAAVPFGLRHMDEDLRYVPSPGQSLARDTRAFHLTTISAGLAAGAAGFVGGSMTSIVEVHGRASVGLVIGDGLGIGVASGLIVGLTFGFYHAASPEFRIVTWWLALHGKAPWRFRRFLDQAYERTVLRQSGATYQFRHIELQVRLAARYRGTEGTPAGLPVPLAEGDGAVDTGRPPASPGSRAAPENAATPADPHRDAN
jgi:NACHT domain